MSHQFLVKLWWVAPDDHGSPITGYIVQRKFSRGKWDVIKQTISLEHTDIPLSFVADPDMITDGAIRYRVCAQNKCGQGKYSKSVEVKLHYAGGLSLHSGAEKNEAKNSSLVQAFPDYSRGELSVSRGLQSQRDSFSGLYMAPGLKLPSSRDRSLENHGNIRTNTTHVKDEEPTLVNLPFFVEDNSFNYPGFVGPKTKDCKDKKGWCSRREIQSPIMDRDGSKSHVQNYTSRIGSKTAALTGNVFHHFIPIANNNNLTTKKQTQYSLLPLFSNNSESSLIQNG